MITRRGIGLLVVAIIGFFVASATRVGWLHIADAVLAGTMVLSAVLPQLSVARLKASAGFTPRRRSASEIAPVAGDAVDLHIALENRAPYPRLFVAASARPTISEGGTPARFFLAHVPARSSGKMSGQIECARRGWQSIDEIRIECRAPFGLFRARRRPAVSARVLVYPMWLPLRQLKLLDALNGEQPGRRPARRGDEVAGSRRYVAGDAMRDMHWKNTARTGRPTVKEFDSGSEETLTIAFETGALLGEGGDTTLEYSISIAASVAKLVLARGGTVQLGLTGTNRDVFYDWTELMTRLALIQSTTSPAMADSLQAAEPGSRMLAIVSGAHYAQVAAMASAAHRGVATAAVVMEGFASGDAAASALRALSVAGVPAVMCRRGQLARGVEAIDRGAVESKLAERVA
ncbi:MAG: DUF58 domain-containing protein [Chloroflexi bacterium]|nr:DUF58 domain-containing protein [Chloroflexota bacterium]